MILIIDKSSSMEGKKIELARQAASGVVENLRPIDTVGVLMFDNSFEWAVTPRHAEDRAMIKRLIAGIRPDGGTQIAPALTEAYKRVLPMPATYKHIVLLTDGISEEGDSMDLARSANNRKITISTVGLGQDVNRSYLEKIATLAGGKSYFLNDPQGLEQILLHDVLEHTGSTAVEKPLEPEVVQASRDSRRRGHGQGARAQRLCALRPQAVGRDDSAHRPQGAAAGTLAVWIGTRRRVHLRRQGPLGRRLGCVERLRQVLDQSHARSSAAIPRQRGRA